MLSTAAVHTTGVNWASILTILLGVSGIASVVGAVIIRRIKANFTESVQTIINASLKPILITLGEHGEDIAYLRGVVVGKQQLVEETKLKAGG